MRKPTAFQFFAAEIFIWISIIGYLIYTDNVPMITIANLGIAAFNMIGTCISSATGWAPWRDS